MSKGKLYLIPTPISGEDFNAAILPMDIKIVGNLKHFIVETPKVARAYLSSIKLSIPIQEIEMGIYDEHSKEEEIQDLIQPLMVGINIGLMTDAGTPCIADPGEEIVMLCQKLGIEIIPMIGPSSIFLTLMASGLYAEKFTFNGYLARKSNKRKRDLNKLLHRIYKGEGTQIFIEAPYRNEGMFKALLELPEDTILCLGIEVNGENEKIITQPISVWKQQRPVLKKVPVIFLLGK
ncbi:SAM-dependent methyltransferase [bacterium]|nr:SAM-dependent methyltransferase [bacterium]